MPACTMGQASDLASKPLLAMLPALLPAIVFYVAANVADVFFHTVLESMCICAFT